MSLMIMPQNISVSLADLATLVDDILYYAGEGSTDFRWYVRRANLALVINSVELHLIQDNSENYQETWSFLDKRLMNLVQVEHFNKKVGDGRSQASHNLHALAHAMRNVFNLNATW